VHRSRTHRLLIGAVAALVLLGWAVWIALVPFLQAMGAALVHRDPLAAADVVAVTLDSGGAGALEAADLVAAGIARRVIVFASQSRAEDREFARRGVAYDDATDRQVRQLRALGVTEIEKIPRAVAGTHDEVLQLLRWCEANRVRTAVLVTTSDHSRRMRRTLDRTLAGHTLAVSVQPARYSGFDPANWWSSRAGLRTGIIELEKLLLDHAQHPLP